MSFLDNNGAAIGGIGGLLIPLLAKALGIGGSSNSLLGATSGSSSLPVPTTPATLGNPATPGDWSPQTDAPTPAMLTQAQKLFPGAPASQLPDYIQANPESFAPGGNPYQDTSSSFDLGAIGDALGKATSGMGGGQQQTYVPPLPPQHSGSGPNPGLMQSMMPNTQMLSMRMPTGGMGVPLGPAASNPLLAMLRSRLGVL